MSSRGASSEPGGERPSALARARARGQAIAEQAEGWVDLRRREVLPIDLAATYYERDRDAFASVLGAAIALRLFLFLVPAVTTAVGLVLLISGSEAVRSLADQANLTSEVASQIETSTRTTTLQALSIFVGSLWLTVWAGRSLTKVLAACAGGAWRMSGRQTKVTVRMAGAVTSLVLLLVVVSAVLNRVRDDLGLAAATTTWGVTAGRVRRRLVRGDVEPAQAHHRPGVPAPRRSAPRGGHDRPAVVHAVLPAGSPHSGVGAVRRASGWRWRPSATCS